MATIQAKPTSRRRETIAKRFRGGKSRRTAAEIRARYGLPRRRFARIVDVSERSLADLEKGKRPSASVARRLTEVDRLHDALSELVKPEAIPPWLDEPNDAFDGLKPIEVIERGESDRLWQMIFYLRAGMPV